MKKENNFQKQKSELIQEFKYQIKRGGAVNGLLLTDLIACHLGTDEEIWEIITKLTDAQKKSNSPEGK